MNHFHSLLGPVVLLAFLLLFASYAYDNTEQNGDAAMIRIDKITIAVSKMKETIKFYSDTFGIDFKQLDMYDRKLYNGTIGEMELLFCPKDLANVDADINTIQLRFVIKDVKGAYERALRSGGTVITEVQHLDGRFHASLRDPDGNSLEIIQMQ